MRITAHIKQKHKTYEGDNVYSLRISVLSYWIFIFIFLSFQSAIEDPAIEVQIEIRQLDYFNLEISNNYLLQEPPPPSFS